MNRRALGVLGNVLRIRCRLQRCSLTGLRIVVPISVVRLRKRKKDLEFMKSNTDNKLRISKSFFAMSKDEKEALLGEAAAEAIAEAHAAGHSTTHGDEKGVYRLYPDGHKEYIKRYTKNDSQE